MRFRNQILEQIWRERTSKNGETYEENLHRVAKHCSTNDEEEKSFFGVMSDRLFFPAGRTMSNSGIGNKLTVNNCFLNSIIKDSMASIFESVKNGALTHKAGGKPQILPPLNSVNLQM